VVSGDGGDVASDLDSDCIVCGVGFGAWFLWGAEWVDTVGCDLWDSCGGVCGSEGVGVMAVLDDVGEHRVLVSHSGDHFMLTFREARELRDYLTRELRREHEVELPEEDG